MKAALTAPVSLLVEAWQELRIHKLRVLLSLIGVGVAVCALTLVVALGAIAEKISSEYMERASGRPVTLTAIGPGANGANAYSAYRDRFDAVLKRFEISHSTAVVQTDGDVAVDGVPHLAQLTAVDPDYRIMHQQVLTGGRWFEPADVRNYSPPVVVAESLLTEAGRNPANLPQTITMPSGATATVVGTVRSNAVGETPAVYFMPEHIGVVEKTDRIPQVQIEMWVPEGGEKELSDQLKKALKEAVGVESVERTDWAAMGDAGVRTVQNILLAISGIIMALGVLGMINIAVVTIQQRIREIGIRRSFGATSGRVFFAVMMESIVGTFVAGVIGVGAAIFILRIPLVTSVLFDGLASPPPFPVSAAVLGLIVAVGVGGLAGLIPALVATRIRIIDAIRT